MMKPEPEPQAPSFDGTQLCRQVNPEIFFPNPQDRRATAMAKEICNQCQFQVPCLEYAMWEPSLDGVWGGTTPRQRESMRTRYRKSVPA